MPRYIVPDTSALAAAFYKEACFTNAQPLLSSVRSRTIDAVAPALALPEFFNASRKKQAGDMKHGFPPVPAAEVEIIVAEFLGLPIVWEDLKPLAVNAWRLHQDFGLQTADAFFLEVARQWQAELWTADEQFYRRAVPVYPRVFNLRAVPFS